MSQVSHRRTPELGCRQELTGTECAYEFSEQAGAQIRATLSREPECLLIMDFRG